MAPVTSDGPADSFSEDPFIKKLTEESRKDADEFGLVVTACWPPPVETLCRPYENVFLPLIRSCFQVCDIETALYLYPSQYLHVTIATLHAFTLQTRNDRAKIQTFWAQLVAKASKRPEWPQKPFNLRIVGSQIGKNAGILLWEDSTGGIDQMRQCIQAQVGEEVGAPTTNGVDVGTLKIPGIIHTTFLRFQSVPKTSASLVQRCFVENVLPKLQDCFSDRPIQITEARFVNERSPYMHIPDDDEHVLQTFTLVSSS